jgi:hypothetical protein
MGPGVFVPGLGSALEQVAEHRTGLVERVDHRERRAQAPGGRLLAEEHRKPALELDGSVQLRTDAVTERQPRHAERPERQREHGRVSGALGVLDGSASVLRAHGEVASQSRDDP